MNVVITFSPVCWQKRRSAADGVLADDAVAGQDHRRLGRLQELRPRGAARRPPARPAAGRGAAPAPPTICGLHDVVGQLEVGGARLLPLGDRECLAHRLGDDLRVVDAGVPLRHRLHHPHDVDVLVALLVHLGEAGLPGQRHHRRAVEEGVGEAGDEVGRARAERPQADAGVAGQAAVGVGHEGGALLVADGDEARSGRTRRARRSGRASPRRGSRRRSARPRSRGTGRRALRRAAWRAV